MSTIITEDGTAIIVDSELGAVSGRNKQEAEAEIRRRKADRDRSDDAPATTRHLEIQMGAAA